MNENENTATPNLWDTVKSMLMGKVHSNTDIPQEKSQINNLTLHLKQLERKKKK